MDTIKPSGKTYASVDALVESLGSPELKAHYTALKNATVESSLVVDIRGRAGSGKTALAFVLYRYLQALLSATDAVVELNETEEAAGLQDANLVGHSHRQRLLDALKGGKRIMIQTTQVARAIDGLKVLWTEEAQRRREDEATEAAQRELVRSVGTVSIDDIVENLSVMPAVERRAAIRELRAGRGDGALSAIFAAAGRTASRYERVRDAISAVR